jgi:hypothetical protein
MEDTTGQKKEGVGKKKKERRGALGLISSPGYTRGNL